eukprot:316698-Alexandrium_andersonii.AAC.1
MHAHAPRARAMYNSRALVHHELRVVVCACTGALVRVLVLGVRVRVLGMWAFLTPFGAMAPCARWAHMWTLGVNKVSS